MCTGKWFIIPFFCVRRAKRVGNAMPLGRRGPSPGALALTMLTWGPRRLGLRKRGLTPELCKEVVSTYIQSCLLFVYSKVVLTYIQNCQLFVYEPFWAPKKSPSPSLLLMCLTHICVSVDHLIGLEVRINRSTVKIFLFLLIPKTMR